MLERQAAWGAVRPGDFVKDRSGDVWHVEAMARSGVTLRGRGGNVASIPLPRREHPVVHLVPTEAEQEKMLDNLLSVLSGSIIDVERRGVRED